MPTNLETDDRRARASATEEINVRKALGDYDGVSGRLLTSERLAHLIVHGLSIPDLIKDDEDAVRLVGRVIESNSIYAQND